MENLKDKLASLSSEGMQVNEVGGIGYKIEKDANGVVRRVQVDFQGSDNPELTFTPSNPRLSELLAHAETAEDIVQIVKSHLNTQE